MSDTKKGYFISDSDVPKKLDSALPEMAKVVNDATGKYAGMQPINSILKSGLSWMNEEQKKESKDA